MKLTLPTDSNERKRYPIRSGCIDYFPAAIAGVAKHSVMGNDKHNPGQELHHSRGKSGDHADCIDRHLTDIADMLAFFERSENKYPADDLLAEANALAWRALALSQELHERFAARPLAPRARLPDKIATRLCRADEVAKQLATASKATEYQELMGSKGVEWVNKPTINKRPHHTWCGLDLDHEGVCAVTVSTSESPVATGSFGSGFASGNLTPSNRVDRVPERGPPASHGPVQEQQVGPQDPHGGPYLP